MSSQTQDKDWRVELENWLQKHPKTMSKDLAELRDAFVQRFPLKSLSKLTLEEYAIGKPDSFCEGLDAKTRVLWTPSRGSAYQWGFFWSASNQEWVWDRALESKTSEAAFKKIKSRLINLLKAADNNHFNQLDNIGSQQLGDNRNTLRAKPLYLYFPEDFLPVTNSHHLRYLLNFFLQYPQVGLHFKNRQLLTFLRW
jgi:hypothetical protein